MPSFVAYFISPLPQFIIALIFRNVPTEFHSIGTLHLYVMITSPNPCHFFPAQPILAIQQFAKRSHLKALLNLCETLNTLSHQPYQT